MLIRDLLWVPWQSVFNVPWLCILWFIPSPPRCHACVFSGQTLVVSLRPAFCALCPTFASLWKYLKNSFNNSFPKKPSPLLIGFKSWLPLSFKPTFMALYKNKVVLCPQLYFLPKVESAFQLNEDIVLPLLCPRPTHPKQIALHTLEVVWGVWVYLLAMPLVRKMDSLVVVTEYPHKGLAASSATFSRWIRQTVVQAQLFLQMRVLAARGHRWQFNGLSFHFSPIVLGVFFLFFPHINGHCFEMFLQSRFLARLCPLMNRIEHGIFLYSP